MWGRLVTPPAGPPRDNPTLQGRVWTVARVDTELADLSVAIAYARDDDFRAACWADVDRLLDIRLQLRTG